jgi:nucleoside-diphosphate-sugar epimerase
MMRLLVTGGTGFLGRHCLNQLSCSGFDVHALAHESMADEMPHITWHRCDLFVEKEVQQLLEKVRPTHLLHLAWIATPGLFWNSPLNYDWVSATVALFNAFREIGGERFVGIGSCAEYDWSPGVCSEESVADAPMTVYGQCKLAAFKALTRLAADTNCSFAWARLFWLFGPHESEQRLVPLVINRLLRGEPAHCTAGTQRRDFLYVKDASRALTQLVSTNLSGPFNIASCQAVAVSDIVRLIGRLMQRSDLLELGSLPSAPDEAALVVAAVDRLQHELRFIPAFSLELALRETIHWWESQTAVATATCSAS